MRTGPASDFDESLSPHRRFKIMPWKINSQWTSRPLTSVHRARTASMMGARHTYYQRPQLTLPLSYP